MGRAKDYKNINKKSGEFIALKRQATGMSQTEIAKLINVSRQQLSKYERGMDILSLPRLTQILDVLGITLSYYIENISDDSMHKASSEASKI